MSVILKGRLDMKEQGTELHQIDDAKSTYSTHDSNLEPDSFRLPAKRISPNKSKKSLSPSKKHKRSKTNAEHADAAFGHISTQLKGDKKEKLI